MIIKNHNEYSKNQNVTILKKSLGSLELEIMEMMWELGESTTPHIVKAIVKKRPQACASVGPVMKRLSSKGLLSRTKDEKGFRYRITRSREQYLSETLSLNRELKWDTTDRSIVM